MIRLTKSYSIKIVIGVVALASLAGIVVWTQSSNTGDINQTATQIEQNPTEKIEQINGQYISFEYSSQYVPRERQNKSDDLEYHELDADKPYPKKISISVSKLPDGTLNSNSAYLLRKSFTEDYRERELATPILNTEIWSSMDGTKQTVFITKNDLVAVFAFTQDGGDKVAYNNEVDAIINSFKWK